MSFLRVFGLIAILGAAGVFAYMQLHPKSPLQSSNEAHAALVLNAASIQLEAVGRATGTFVDAEVGGVESVRVVRSDQVSYCIEYGARGGVFHHAGPGGTPTRGNCPAR